ncbi:hypothetical protein CHLNCDRAFT_144380 [Chlorella variabilis]|uniref:EamA domain-containing protein n=1 Tax=Chlorella variabilis TaxID=554065 RepID=E1ZBB4_CHLVA|nr:hypothetical protein CHLNCDRAFT_144380 [Chlorella variabilis]EFN56827.1 hypothetical protein CHLNCDRAFT_144380 [Chlorella variabilis]|eukprot:XP_005848929.1 hypothetical protein CHLNCDRAFT_144380 [Chlorella variabilis]
MDDQEARRSSPRPPAGQPELHTCEAAQAAEASRLPAAQRLEGQACLLVASLLLAYNLPDPPAPVVLAAARGTLQLLLLLGPSLLLGGGAAWRPATAAAAHGAGLEPHVLRPAAPEEAASSGAEEPSEDEELGQPLLHARAPAQPAARQRGRPPWQPPPQLLYEVPEPAGGLEPWPAAVVVVEEVAEPPPRLPLGLPAPLLATLEIGLYNTTGTLAQTTGLELTTATRAAFLIQASILFTPVLAALAGRAPSGRVWAGSLLALVGTLLITLDRWMEAHLEALPAAAGAATAATAAPAATSPVGDALMLFAALCYSASTVRIPVWAVRHSVASLQLALGKSAFLAAVSAAVLGLEAARVVAAGEPATALWPGWRGWEGWAIISWSALGPGALAAVLHVKGQSLLPDASKAQIIFCSVPLWSALMAALVLPGEKDQIGLATWLGGGVIAAASLVAALPRRGRR